MKFYNKRVFTKFLTHVVHMLFTFNMFEHSESYKKYIIKPFQKK